jgi:hypothetical protein
LRRSLLAVRLIDYRPASAEGWSAGRKSAGRAAMQQIADWLENLGMSEYAQRFAENRIDFSVLRT